jgi:hypothetical protein
LELKTFGFPAWTDPGGVAPVQQKIGLRLIIHCQYGGCNDYDSEPNTGGVEFQ